MFTANVPLAAKVRFDSVLAEAVTPVCEVSLLTLAAMVLALSVATVVYLAEPNEPATVMSLAATTLVAFLLAVPATVTLLLP
ncbi:hypothetical protein D3C72_2414380 [compost metagenome]